MNNTFDTNDFEGLLKQKVEEFTMYPSKRIWHSIYNNIHPSKRWPSFAMSILLIAILFLVGYLNTNTSIKQNADLSQLSHTGNTGKAITTKVYNSDNTGTKATASLIVSSINTKTFTVPVSANRSHNSATNNKKLSTESKAVSQKNNTKTFGSLTASLQKKIKNADGSIASAAYGKKNAAITDMDFQLNKLNTDQDNTSAISITAKENATSQSAMADKAFIENYALYNKPVANAYNNKLAVQLYVTPSMVYRMLINKLGNNAVSTQLAARSNTAVFSGDLVQKPSVGFEAGAGLQYLITNSISFKTGFQFNYTRYNSLAFENPHSISTSLTMADQATGNNYEVFKSTPYTNSIGTDPVKLHNETYQLSIPVGADFTLAGKNKLQWHVGATIQPTYVINGNSYLPSTSGNAYVKDITYLNRWNLNAGVETFISYKVKDITWQVGPQYRMQLFTTNNKSYFMNEKLTNYGLKIGISKTIH